MTTIGLRIDFNRTGEDRISNPATKHCLCNLTEGGDDYLICSRTNKPFAVIAKRVK